MPSVAGTSYDVFFGTMPALHSGDAVGDNLMNFSFDVVDGSAAQQGTVYLEKVELFSYDIP